MTQTEAVLAFLRAGQELTPLDALNRLGCMRLAARIDDLRRAGHPIETRIEKRGRKRFASYRLAGPVQAELFQIPPSTGRLMAESPRGGRGAGAPLQAGG